MNKKKYNQFRAAVVLFMLAIIVISIWLQLYFLAVVGVFTAAIFLMIVQSQTKLAIDEREQTIREKAAHTTYAIFAPTVAICALLLLIPSHGDIFPVFAKGEFLFIESIGMILAYLTLLLVVIFSLSYYWLQRKFGGKSDQK